MKLDSLLANFSTLIICLFLVNESFAQECGPVIPRKKSNTLGAGRKEAEQGAWPWMVAITMRGRSGKFDLTCSGAMITKRHVLSVAHCFDRRDPSLYIARVGHINLNLADEHQISQIKIPDTYKRRQFYDDIAVLTLSKDVNVNTDINTHQTSSVLPICLPSSPVYADLKGKIATTVGWGFTEPDRKSSNTLMEVLDIPIISNHRCNATFSRVPSFLRQFPSGIDDGIICAGFLEGKEDKICTLYSGAPLMYMEANRWEVIGMSSFGFSCHRYGYPAGYTRVSKYLNWILQNIKT